MGTGKIVYYKKQTLALNAKKKKALKVIDMTLVHMASMCEYLLLMTEIVHAGALLNCTSTKGQDKVLRCLRRSIRTHGSSAFSEPAKMFIENAVKQHAFAEIEPMMDDVVKPKQQKMTLQNDRRDNSCWK